MSLSPGTKLGCYEILTPLGAGGMGEVYRARDSRLEREVAIKVLSEGLAKDDVARIGGADAAFAREFAAAIGIERRHGIPFDIGRALAPVEHVIGRDVNERNPAAPGLDCKSRRRVGIDSERSCLFAFRTIDIGIGSRVDDSAPRLHRDHPRDRARIFQVECSLRWRNNFNILGKR